MLLAKLGHDLISAILDAPVNHQVHAVDLKHFLGKDGAVVTHVVLNLYLVPLLADPALRAVLPVSALLDIVIA